MTGFFLPADGSVLIVDDKTEDALPLIELLSSKGIACTYYSGADEKLPPEPTQKVRLAFFDIQLFPSSNPTSYAANILRLIEALIPTNNGPYVLILWTTMVAHEADEVEQQLRANLTVKKPLEILKLEKSEYFETVSDDSMRDSLVHEINDTLSSRLPRDDIQEIQRIIDRELQPFGRQRRAKSNAIDKISLELNKKLQNAAESFQLFTHWEHAINKAAGKTVETYSTLHTVDPHWSSNIKSSILRLAHAQLGKNIPNIDEDEILINALKTVNSTFLDLVEHHYPKTSELSESIKFSKNNIQYAKTINSVEYKIKRNIRKNKYRIYVDGRSLPKGGKDFDLDKIPKQGNAVQQAALKELVDDYLKITPSINAKLLIDTTSTDSVQPGNIYFKDVSNWRRRANLLKTYKPFYKKDVVLNGDGNCILKSAQTKEFQFIELEVTPVCDYAQRKWIKYRLLPGILIPSKYCDLNAKAGENFYPEIPILTINGNDYKMVFDFRLLKSHHHAESELMKPNFRIRNVLCASILSRLSSHASRIGITSLE